LLFNIAYEQYWDAYESHSKSAGVELYLTIPRRIQPMKLVPAPSKKKLTVSEYCSKCGIAIYSGWPH